jgi:hypothetical protein
MLPMPKPAREAIAPPRTAAKNSSAAVISRQA